MSDDLYACFAVLSAAEREGEDYRIESRPGASGLVIIAPHGGGIEGGTTELADAVAGAEHTYYSFVGLKSSGNKALHITSHCFDEPRGLALVSAAQRVVALHGVGAGPPAVYVGGRDEALGQAISASLRAAGFLAQAPPGHLAGQRPENICNRGASGAGVQLELTRSLRASMFAGLGAAERRERTEVFEDFVSALRSALK